MEQCDNFNHQPVVVLASASIHDVDMVLNHLALAIRYRDNNLPPPLPEKPPFTRWTEKAIDNGTEDLAPSISQPECQPEPAALDRKVTEPGAWDERAAETKVYLMRRLYQAALHREIELWNLFNERVKEPPRDLNDIQTWVKTANIHTSDLLKFCERERVKVEVEQEVESKKPGELPSSAGGSTKEPAQPEDSVSSVRRKIQRTRKDELAVLIDQMLSKDPSLTASEVMMRLAQQVGTPYSIICSFTGDGIKWESLDGGPVMCTRKNLEDRLFRWKKKHKNPGVTLA